MPVKSDLRKNSPFCQESYPAQDLPLNFRLQWNAECDIIEKNKTTGGKNVKKKRKGALRLAGTFLRESWHWFALSILATSGAALTGMLTPQIVRVTVDSVLGNEPLGLPAWIENQINAAGGTAFLRENLWVIGVVVVAVAVLAALFHYGSRVLNTRAAETLVKTMRDKIFRHLLKLPQEWYQGQHTGDIIQRCTSDVNTVKDFLSEQLVSVFRIIVMLILSLTFMFSISRQLTFIALASVPILLGGSFLFHRMVSPEFEICDENESRLSAIVQENLSGVRVVRAFGREAYEIEKFDRQNDHYQGLWDKVNNLFMCYWSATELVMNIQILLLIVFGAVFAVRGGLTAGGYIAFLSYHTYLSWPIRQLGRSISEMSKAGVSLRRVGDILSAKPEQDPPCPAETDFRGDIVFDRVSFSFDGKTPVLEDVSFTVPAGKTVGILGGTGSGKSTLMRLLDCLLTLPEGNGSITVGGTDIRALRAADVRANVGLVLQEPFLFSRTLGENLRMANPEASDADIARAAHTACLDSAVEKFTEGYETFVGERGVTLSGGQKQRAAIARTLVQNTPILVFDDSLSAVDTETDAAIRARLAENTGGRTTLLISHRTATLRHTDCIVVLERGRVAEIGTHEELLAKNGIYRRIHDIQNGKEETGLDT